MATENPTTNPMLSRAMSKSPTGSPTVLRGLPWSPTAPPMVTMGLHQGGVDQQEEEEPHIRSSQAVGVPTSSRVLAGVHPQVPLLNILHEMCGQMTFAWQVTCQSEQYA